MPAPQAGGEAQEDTPGGNLRNAAILQNLLNKFTFSVLAYPPLPPLAREAISLYRCICLLPAGSGKKFQYSNEPGASLSRAITTRYFLTHMSLYSTDISIYTN